MKKFVTLALALIMALSLAAPALAFTGMEYEAAAESGIALDIRLVDVSTGYVGINFSAPPTNRGYASGQLICAIVDMKVPAGKTPHATYDTLVFSGKNVSLWQDENFRPVSYGAARPVGVNGGGVGTLRYISQNAASAISDAITAAKVQDSTEIPDYAPFAYAANMALDNQIILDLQINAKSTDGSATSNGPYPIFTGSDQTYQFAVFGRVTADDASMTATLKGVGALVNAVPENGTTKPKPAIITASALNTVPVKSGNYHVGYFNPNIDGVAAADAPSKGATNASTVTMDTIADAAMGADKFPLADKQIAYIVSGKADGTVPKFAIVTDNAYNCKGMYLFDSSTPKIYQVSKTNASNANAVYVDCWGIYVQFTYIATAKVTLLDPKNTTDAGMIAKLQIIIADDIFGTFGLDVSKSGQMKPEWWTKDAALSASVKVEPWYAEVTVPPEIEIEIPKTGDALSVMGFVLIALAGLAVVAVRKVKA